jgi:hypothetical protein
VTREPYAFTGQAIQIRRSGVAITVAAKHVSGVIVGVDEE